MIYWIADNYISIRGTLAMMVMTACIPWRVLYKRQERLAVREHLCSSLVLWCIFCVVLLVFFLCLSLSCVSNVAVIALSVFLNVYFHAWVIGHDCVVRRQYGTYEIQIKENERHYMMCIDVFVLRHVQRN